MIKKIITHKFFTASIWIFLSTGILNFGNYLFHIIMYRLLGQSKFGLLESTISLLYILTIPIMTLSLVIVKYVSYYRGRENHEAISHFYHYLMDRTIKYGIIVSVVLLVISPLFMKLLRIPNPFIAVLIIAIFLIGLLTNINRSFLQGITNFFAITVSSVADVVGKLALSIFIVALGFGVEGALSGMIISAILGYFVSSYFIKNIKPKKGIFHEKKKMITYAVPVFFMSLAMTSLYTADVILARYYLPSALAGSYAALSVLGKIVVFGVSPLVQVMFPFVSENHARGEKHSHYLFISLLLTCVGGIVITTCYFLAPRLIVGLLYATSDKTITQNVGMFGVFMSIYAICSLLANYYLAIHRTKPIIAVSTAAVAQIIGIILFHNTIEQMIMVSISVLFVLLLSLLLYYLYEKLRS